MVEKSHLIFYKYIKWTLQDGLYSVITRDL